MAGVAGMWVIVASFARVRMGERSRGGDGDLVVGSVELRGVDWAEGFDQIARFQTDRGCLSCDWACATTLVTGLADVVGAGNDVSLNCGAGLDGAFGASGTVT